ncbi:RagB/SusD family nutrient uptake outer membrane protein [Chitinophaga barathri]|uniref:RagB/SusD family nutrient uptake outer membrane protein n=1 Tax=Chitinophaga barathri TaxID=1647451 RepID=A0A3N4MES6_9BACT|nr:RagB/SusD family nutrient uptake outer membrane protein [Chitinophaga barathri]RPD42434.1 RagB/SusD family nutrient uptake outer membrane protein [Chitinophaga barathri]
MTRNLLLSFSAILAFSACANKLDVRPDNLVAPSQVNSQNLPLVLNGAKLGLTNNAFYGYFALSDYMSDDVQGLSLAGYENCNIPVNDNSLTFAYRYPYQCIGNANAVINYGEAHASETALNATVGEACLLRAFAYTILHEQFGKVALMKGGEDPLTLPERNTEADVKAFIENDLKKAAELLPDHAGQTLKASKQAAQLLLARFYLNEGNYAEALRLAELVISSGKFALQPDKFGDIFKYNTASKEMIYAIGETSTGNNVNYGLPSIYGPGGKNPDGTSIAGSGNTWIDSTMVKTYEDTDTRKAYYLKKTGTSITIEVYFLTKFPMEATPAYPICRYSEAYLVAAEAKARAGTVDVTRFNELRAKRGASLKNNSDYADAPAFLNEIEMERRREFVGERMRWSDMRRFGKATPWLSGLRQPEGHVLMPVPERILVLNPNVKQNADY